MHAVQRMHKGHTGGTCTKRIAPKLAFVVRGHPLAESTPINPMPAGTASRIGGVSFEQLAADQLKLHAPPSYLGGAL